MSKAKTSWSALHNPKKTHFFLLLLLILQMVLIQKVSHLYGGGRFSITVYCNYCCKFNQSLWIEWPILTNLRNLSANWATCCHFSQLPSFSILLPHYDPSSSWTQSKRVNVIRLTFYHGMVKKEKEKNIITFGLFFRRFLELMRSPVCAHLSPACTLQRATEEQCSCTMF